ncbi:biopolymer transporter ExbD [bacterium]|nr:biopolymer transporter ExbD [bacterium]
MAFKKKPHDNRKIQMVSLIDLIFMLLLFFIITSVMIKLTRGESKLYIPTPKNEPGEAQILIQILDQNRYLWLDHTAIDTLYTYARDLKNPNDPQAKIDLLVDKVALSGPAFFSRLQDLVESTKTKRKKDYFVLIRCPNAMPYHYATNIIEKLAESPYFEYGCVSGSLEELRKSRSIRIEDNVLEIDF